LPANINNFYTNSERTYLRRWKWRRPASPASVLRPVRSPWTARSSGPSAHRELLHRCPGIRHGTWRPNHAGAPLLRPLKAGGARQRTHLRGAWTKTTDGEREKKRSNTGGCGSASADDRPVDHRRRRRRRHRHQH
jgi:hypothetical protein